MTALKPPPRSFSAETATLREIILGKLGKRVGKTAADLMSEVRDDFGSVDDRRFYRQLHYLIDVGCARREKDSQVQWDRVSDMETPVGRRGAPPIYFYYLVSTRLPQAGKSFCERCGLVGARTSSHPHKRLLQDLAQAASAGHRARTAEARSERTKRGVEIARRRLARAERIRQRAVLLLELAEGRAALTEKRAKRAKKHADRVAKSGAGVPFYVPLKSAERPPSADNPGSRPPAETSRPPAHPPAAARRAS
ncbi:MAG TPA: hypothetical protein VFZ00_11300 [Solirubrobacter sp.]|nr:hypothetical protein [Solirubrobacter sp.]